MAPGQATVSDTVKPPLTVMRASPWKPVPRTRITVSVLARSRLGNTCEIVGAAARTAPDEDADVAPTAAPKPTTGPRTAQRPGRLASHWSHRHCSAQHRASARLTDENRAQRPD